jgi:IS4 transposase
MVAISTNLIEWGMKAGTKNTHVAQIKYTIATKGSFPCYVKVFDKPQELCEDKTIPVAIMDSEISKTGIIVFDRGVQERKAYEKMTQSDRLFVTRIKTDVRYKEIKKIQSKGNKSNTESTVIIEEDLEVLLKNRNEKWTEESFRLIKTSKKESEEPIYFLTNIFYLSALEIAFIYKQRWEVEVYFKYLKQHLNLKHLVSRNENGIKVMIYMTLILSILLIAFKKLNKVESFKIAKLRFSLELEQSIVKQIVLLTGGNPDKMAHLFNDA